MPTFAELYTPLQKDVFARLAQEQLAQGTDGLTCASEYAEQGKPDFALAYLLRIDAAEEVKRSIFAYAFERRALLSEEKAASFNRQFHRPFPLIKAEAQKDRIAAKQVREGCAV